MMTDYKHIMQDYDRARNRRNRYAAILAKVSIITGAVLYVLTR